MTPAARRRRTSAVAAVLVALALTGCSVPPAPAASTTAASTLGGELTVYAAASLRSAFDEIAADFAAANPGVTVRPIVYDGSSTLVTQLTGGASADVFASADEANMAKLVDAGLVEDPEVFATNTLVIAVPTDNPAGIASLADLARPGTTVVLCAPEVPCGSASQRLLSAAGVSVTAASLEQNVTAVLTKVAAGEADAGLVYATDARGEADVTAIVPEGASDVVNRYPIAVLDDAPNAAAAAAFRDRVLGPDGQAVLADRGFGAP